MVGSPLRGAAWSGAVAAVLAVVGSQGLASAGCGLVSSSCCGSGSAAVVCSAGVACPPSGSPAVALVESAVAVAACWVVGLLGRFSVLGPASAPGWESVTEATLCGGSLSEGVAVEPCAVGLVSAFSGLPRRV